MNGAGALLYSADSTVFRFCNGTLVFGVGDWLFPFLTNTDNFIVPYAVVLAGLVFFGKRKGVVVICLIAAAVLLGDQLSSSIIKPLVGRTRPCAFLPDVRLLVGCGGGKSFPSSHAVNNFSVAFVVAAYYRRVAWWVFLYAALVAYSRVYVGVHYPSDILAGAAVGLVTGWVVVRGADAVRSILFRQYSSVRKGERPGTGETDERDTGGREASDRMGT
ncbi:MAG: phosphatase PAP2 family protein [Bacteroidota bacterium]|nr:phosphatase PAP2 family protein [Bacteroidota bacterium]